ncbi:MAG: hypothetical protein WAV76_05995 [Bacteroidota bacterium]
MQQDGPDHHFFCKTLDFEPFIDLISRGFDVSSAVMLTEKKSFI